jgi:hypothetical protein
LYDYGLAFAFAALRQPCGETFSKPFRSKAKTGFDLAIGDGKSIVKVGGVGEIAHAKLVEPIERADASCAAYHNVDMEFLCVHEAQEAGLKIRLNSLRKIGTGDAQPVRKRGGA